MKKFMKKFTTLAVAFAMVVTLTGVGYAEDPAQSDVIKAVSDSNTATRDVTATVTPSNPADVISVNIAWQDLKFSNTTVNGTWKPDAHEYETSGKGTWSGNGTITVTNHSNVGITAIGLLGNGTVTGATQNGAHATIDSNELKLATAVDTAVKNAPSEYMTVKVEGDPTKSMKDFVLDTVTVTITKTNA